MKHKQLYFINKSFILPFLLFCIFLMGIIYRAYGIFENHPFWVDEFSTASQARYFLQYKLGVFTNSAINFEHNNYLFNIVVAFFFKLFGQSEMVARLPSVLIGSLIPVVIFIVTKYIFNIRTALIASLLTICSYLEIAWSQQARSYMFIQFFVLLTIYLYFLVSDLKTRTPITLSLFFLSVILGVLTHSIFFLLIIALIIHATITNNYLIKNLVKHPLTLGISIIIFATIGIALYLNQGLNIGNLLKANNVWYYHSFLWRDYGLITFLALLGMIFSFFTHRKYALLIIIYIIFHFLFFCFVFAPYTSRYLLPIIPLLFIMMAYALTYSIDLFLEKNYSKIDKKWLQFIIPLGLILFVIGNGYKFDIKPNRFYSVNHDFREIALIDYNQVYSIIKSKGELNQEKTAVIDTWHDRLYWYLGMDYKPAYIFRWIHEDGLINGLQKKTDFVFNNNGEKIIPRTNNLRFIGELSDLKKAMKKYPKGFIFIDDSSLPKDVIDYVEKNFKKELYLDHYPLDDNPYSIWPATLYSWGIK